jgi:hypothetical protein
VKGGGRGKEIEVWNGLTAPAKVGTNPGKPFHNRIAQIEHPKRSEESADLGNVEFPPWAKRTLANFTAVTQLRKIPSGAS